MERNQCHRHRGNAQNLPGEVLEQVLAHVPFEERCGKHGTRLPTLGPMLAVRVHLQDL